MNEIEDPYVYKNTQVLKNKLAMGKEEFKKIFDNPEAYGP